MPRNMSFSMTTEAVRNRTKTVTRRLGWDFLKPGDLLWACEKCQGLKKGEKVKRICPIRVVSNRVEAIGDICEDYPYGSLYGWEEVIKEGFTELTPWDFVERFCEANGCDDDVLVNRIEFEYVEASDAE